MEYIFGLMVKMLVKVLCPILEYLDVIPTSGSWLQLPTKQILGGSRDDLNSWVPAFHVSDLD